MYNCDICGRAVIKKIRMHGYTLCSKHMHQLLKYGKFLDNIPRTNSDLNDYEIYGEITEFELYNQANANIGSFIIDTEDIEKVKYHKWRMSHSHVVTGLPAKKTQRDISHVVLNIPREQDHLVVDHINGDPMDNRKCNLRICTQSENVLNKSKSSLNTSGYIGVSYRKDRNAFDPEIRRGYIRCHLGYTKTFEEAVYKRMIAEKLVFGEFANKKALIEGELITHCLSDEQKSNLYNITIERLRNKCLWQ